MEFISVRCHLLNKFLIFKCIQGPILYLLQISFSSFTPVEQRCTTNYQKTLYRSSENHIFNPLLVAFRNK